MCFMFQNLEIISVKEKCKKLESTKIKLTQVTVGNHDASQRYLFIVFFFNKGQLEP